MFLFGSKADIILFVFRTDQRLWKIEWDLSIKKLHSLVSSGRWDLRTEFNPFLFFSFNYTFCSFFCCQSTDIKYSVYVIWFDQICFTFPIYRPIKLYYLNIPNKQTQPRLWMSSWRENKKLVSIKLFDKSKKISSALMVVY